MNTILVVEDESNMRFAVRTILEDAGYTVLEAPHGAAALERIEESRPDLVVTDLMLPVMGGRELIERLRADPDTEAIPIVVITATGSLVTPADVAIGKPFKPEILVEAVDSLVAKASERLDHFLAG